MKISPQPAILGRFRFFYVAALLAAFFSTVLIAQQDGVNQNDQSNAALDQFMDGVEREAAGLKTGFGRFLELVLTELDGIEGTYLADRVDFIIQRYQSDQTARILWILIVLLLTSGSIFILSVGFGILVRPRRIDSAKFKKPPKPASYQRRPQHSKSQAKKNSRTYRVSAPPKSMVGMLKEGRLNDVEKLLIEEHRKQPTDATTVMYLLACRAVNADVNSYDDLISELFSQGLDSSVQICLHAAEIGRLLELDKFPLTQYPEPEKPFEVDTAVSGNTLGPISEFGGVQTLLDLVRVYVDMGDDAETKHLIVEILVRGNRAQRKQALDFKRRMERQKSVL